MAVYPISSRLAGLVPPLPVQLVLAGVAAAAIFGSQFIGGATSESGKNPNSSLGASTDAMVETGAPVLTFSNQTADFGPSVNELLKLYPVVDESPVQDESSMQNDAVSAVLNSQPEAEQAPVAEVAPAVQQSAPVATVSPQTQAPAAPAPVEAAPAPVAAAPVVSIADKWRALGVVLEGSEAWDEVSLANVDAAFSAIPARLVGSLGNPALGPVHVSVNPVGRTLSGSQPYGGAANFFSTNDGVNELVLYPRQTVFTIVHELGHAYNLRRTAAGRYAMVLLDPEMQSFMAATGWRVLSTPDEIRAAVDHMSLTYANEGGFSWPRLSHNDPLEDFANSFAAYYTDPSGLQSMSPARYAWFAANVGR